MLMMSEINETILRAAILNRPFLEIFLICDMYIVMSKYLSWKYNCSFCLYGKLG
jgi:hypothetical protein